MTPDFNAAVQAFQRGDLAGAIAACDRVIAQPPGNPEAFHLKAMCLGRLNRIDDAIPVFEQAAASHPRPAAVLANYANALVRAGRTDASIEIYRKALKAEPQFVAAMVGLGSALNGQQRYEEARDTLQRAAAITPRDATIQNQLGVALQNLGDEDAADKAFADALAINPNSHPARINRSALRRSRGDLNGAIADCEAVLRAGDRSANAYWQYAAALRALGRIDEASRAFEAALSANPLNTDIQSEYASMRWEAGDSQGYLSGIDQYLRANPDPKLFILKAGLALRAGQAEIALEAAQQAVRYGDADPSAHGILGEVLTLTDQPERGVESLERAFRLQPENFKLRHDYAEALLGLHRFKDVEAVLSDDAPDSAIQRHTALKTLAWRALGDERYRDFYDYERLTQKRFIETPPGYSDLDAFNAALAKEITAIHTTKSRPLDQTLFGGTQSRGRLWNVQTPAIQALAGALMKAGQAFIGGLPREEGHPFLRRNTGKLRLSGAWSVKLQSGGGHVDHIHPAGWISASYYVQVPPGVNENSHEGWLRLGASGVKGLELDAEHWVRPEPGAAVFFPSYLWHGVDPFHDTQDRITAPFDMLPGE